MELLPKDINKYTEGRYNINTGRDFYEKKAIGSIPLAFYFRLSVNHSMNSTIVFICNDKGESLTPSAEEQLEYEKYYHYTSLWEDGRFVIISNDNDDSDDALWQVSSYRNLARKHQDFIDAAPNMLLEFRSKLQEATDLETIRNLFEEKFADALDNMQEMQVDTKRHPDVSPETRLQNITDLIGSLLTQTAFAEKINTNKD